MERKLGTTILVVYLLATTTLALRILGRKRWPPAVRWLLAALIIGLVPIFLIWEGLFRPDADIEVVAGLVWMVVLAIQIIVIAVISLVRLQRSRRRDGVQPDL